MKTYRAETTITLDIIVRGVKHHIKFDSATNGGSMFTTNNPDFIAAMDRHIASGKAKYQEVIFEKPAVAKKEQQKQNKIKEVKVTDLDSAKEYLAENHGYARTRLRSKTAILEAAEASNIKFIGL